MYYCTMFGTGVRDTGIHGSNINVGVGQDVQNEKQNAIKHCRTFRGLIEKAKNDQKLQVGICAGMKWGCVGGCGGKQAIHDFIFCTAKN